MNDMTVDEMAQHGYGAVALKKMGPVPENFRLYLAHILDNGKSDTVLVCGAEFRVATKGEFKGVLSVMVKGTVRRAKVNRQEIQEYHEKQKAETVDASGAEQPAPSA